MKQDKIYLIVHLSNKGLRWASSQDHSGSDPVKLGDPYSSLLSLIKRFSENYRLVTVDLYSPEGDSAS